jgi:hypothetical protein
MDRSPHFRTLAQCRMVAIGHWARSTEMSWDCDLGVDHESNLEQGKHVYKAES